MKKKKPIKDNAVVKIEKGIQMPPNQSGRRRKYPFLNEMGVGDSFFVQGMSQAAMSSCTRWASIKTGFKFATRRVDGGVRVWRIK